MSRSKHRLDGSRMALLWKKSVNLSSCQSRRSQMPIDCCCQPFSSKIKSEVIVVVSKKKSRVRKSWAKARCVRVVEEEQNSQNATDSL
jgi:hypothetical protein